MSAGSIINGKAAVQGDDDTAALLDARLAAEAAEKSRSQPQGYLKGKKIKATGTTVLLREAYFAARKDEETGVVPAGAATAGTTKKSTKTTAATRKKKEPPWETSAAKARLYADIMAGTIPLNPEKKEDEVEVEPIFQSRTEFINQGGRDKFLRRLNDLRSQIQASLSRADDDEKAYQIFVKNHPTATVSTRGYPEWDGSKAQALLKEDMAKGVHTVDDFYPKDFRATRPEYEEFPLKVFRDHVYQAIRTSTSAIDPSRRWFVGAK